MGVVDLNSSRVTFSFSVVRMRLWNGNYLMRVQLITVISAYYRLLHHTLIADRDCSQNCVNKPE